MTPTEDGNHERAELGTVTDERAGVWTDQASGGGRSRPPPTLTSFSSTDAAPPALDSDAPSPSGVFSNLLKKVKFAVGTTATALTGSGLASALAPSLATANADVGSRLTTDTSADGTASHSHPSTHHFQHRHPRQHPHPYGDGSHPIWRLQRPPAPILDVLGPANAEAFRGSAASSPSTSIGGGSQATPKEAVEIVRAKDDRKFGDEPAIRILELLSAPPPLSAESADGNSPGGRKENISNANSLAPSDGAPLRKSNSISKVINRLRGGEPVRREYWMRDDNCKECYECSSSFTAFRRKHHCRICGQIFCSKCASQTIPGERFGYKRGMRVCNYCFKLQQQYAAEEAAYGNSYYPDTPGTASFTVVDYSEKGVHQSPVMRGVADADQCRDAGNHAPSIASQQLTGSVVGAQPEAPSLDTIRRMLTTAGSSFFSQRTRSNTFDESAENLSSPAPFRKKLMASASKTSSLSNLETAVDAYGSEDDDDPHYSTLTSAPANLLKFLASSGQLAASAASLTSTPEAPDNAAESPYTPAESEYYGSDDADEWDYSTTARPKSQGGRGRLDRTEEMRIYFNKNMTSGGRDRASSRRRSYHGRPRRVFRQHSRTSSATALAAHDSSSKGERADPVSPNPLASSLLASVFSSTMIPVTVDHSRGHRRGQSGPLNVELNAASLQHLRRLLRQVLTESEVTQAHDWEDVLMRLMLKVSSNLSPDVRDGDDRDIRHYVKVKKIPGGTPQDSSYVRGVVCSKNVAHKRMARSVHHPRILILTFPLEYQRVENQFLSLEPVLAQEREHLQNLVDRLVALRPTLVLVERTVSRLALEFLLKARIPVAFNMKPSAISLIARCTRADVLQSIDKLSLYPRLGTCGSFTVRTFVHEYIPGRRKTYLFFDDCPKELGCSLVLRGAENGTLKKIKQIVGLLVFVVYNLKLETFLLKDQFASAPIDHAVPVPLHNDASSNPTCVGAAPAGDASVAQNGKVEAGVVQTFELVAEPAVADSEVVQGGIMAPNSSGIVGVVPEARPSIREWIDQVENYFVNNEVSDHIQLSTAISQLAGAPALWWNKHVENTPEKERVQAWAELREKLLQSLCERSSRAVGEKATDQPTVTNEEARPETVAGSGQNGKEPVINVEDSEKAKNGPVPPMLTLLSASQARAEMRAYIREGNNLESRVETALRPYEITILSASPYVEFPAPYVLTRMRKILNEEEERDAKGAAALCATTGQAVAQRSCDFYERLTQLKAGEAYLQENSDNITPYAHQSLVVLYFMISTVVNVPCNPPELMVIEYYRGNDITLGQYLEKMCFECLRPCPVKSCEALLRDHYQSYVHDGGRVNVKVRQLPTQIADMEDTILMWSYCKACSSVTGVVPMSEESWKYSFGKYLELSFYGGQIGFRPEICPHKLYRDHVRCFGFHGLVVQFEYETVDICVVAVPPMKVFINPEANVKWKKKDRDTIRGQVVKYFDSMLARVKSFSVEKEIQPVKQEACRAELTEFTRRAMADKSSLLQLLARVDMSTPADDTLALHSVRRVLQKLTEEYEADFADFVRRFIQPERDLKRLTAGQLRRLFADRDYDQTPYLAVRATHAAFMQDVPLVSHFGDEYTSEESIPEHCLPKTGTSPTTSSFVSPWAASQSSPSQRAGGFPFEFENTPSFSLDPAVSRRLSLSAMRDARTATAAASEKAGSECSNPLADPQARPRLQQLEPAKDAAAATLPPVRSGIGGGMEENPVPFEASAPDEAAGPPSALCRPASRASAVSFVEDITPPSDDRTCRIRHSSGYERKHHSAIHSPSPGPGSRDSASGDESSKNHGFCKRRTVYQSGIPIGLVANRISRFGSPTPIVQVPLSARGVSHSREEGRSAALASLEGKGTRSAGTVTFAPGVDTHGRRRARWAAGVAGHGRQTLLYRRQASQSQKYAIEVYSNVTDAVKDDESDEEGYEGIPERRSAKAGETGETETGTAEEESDEEQEHRDFLSLIQPDPTDVGGGEGAGSVNKNYIYFTYLGQEHDGAESPGPESMAPASVRPGFLVTTSGTNSSPGSTPGSAGLPATPTSPAAGGGSLLAPAATSAVAAGLNAAGLTVIGGDQSVSSETPGSTGAERVSIMKTLTTLWGGNQSGNMLPLEYPIHNLEHIFADSLVIVKEDEPGTLIAFALSSKHYHEKLKSMRQGRTHPATPSTTNAISPTSDSLAPQTAEEKQQAKAWHGTDLEDVSGDIEETLLRTAGTHIKYQYTDGPTRFFCKIFYAEQFDALRRNCGFESELYIHSLARCVKWDASGGKSGSAFVKTRDDRLVMKQLSKPEMDAFLNFAPLYFEYMSQAFFHGLPTVLAKIFGFYRVGYRNQATGRNMRLDVIVMENLFYERRISRIFDLKGSTRNRHVQPTGKESETLLDENFVEQMNRSPMFIRELDKKLLTASLKNDTLFLAKLNVMDYSLLVGIDEDRKDMVVGIVDFIRTFTWDKKIESWVKETGFMGGGGKEPTIISPRQYRVRFRAAMEKYFLMVPTQWTTVHREAAR